MIDAELSRRFAALADLTDDGSWSEVTQRAAAVRPRRHRLIVAVAAAVAVALAAAPALGLGGKVVRLFGKADPAPARVVHSFAGWNELDHPALGPGVRSAGAIKVLEERVGPDSTAVLWLAPARVGFCTLLELDAAAGGGGGGCGLVGDAALDVDVGIHGVSRDGSTIGGPVVLDGSTPLRRADSLELAFQDGESTSIPLVWVTAPVSRGFFVYGVPRSHWRPGHLPTTLTLLAADGDELAQRQVTGVAPVGR